MICIFPIDQRGHCLILKFSKGIEVYVIVNGKKVKFALIHFFFFVINDTLVYKNYVVKFAISLTPLFNYFFDLILTSIPTTVNSPPLSWVGHVASLLAKIPEYIYLWYENYFSWKVTDSFN